MRRGTERAYAQIQQVIAQERPDIAHCHNLLPLVSPAAYYACKSAGVPVVQTLHNYRLRCPTGTLYADGQICDDCAHGLTRGVARGCYRDSHLQTATVAMMLGTHRLLGTWERSVDAYVALNRFARDYFVSAGLPAAKVHVKPNFLLDDPSSPRLRGRLRFVCGQACSGKGRSGNAGGVAAPSAHSSGSRRRRAVARRSVAEGGEVGQRAYQAAGAV